MGIEKFFIQPNPINYWEHFKLTTWPIMIVSSSHDYKKDLSTKLSTSRGVLCIIEQLDWLSYQNEKYCFMLADNGLMLKYRNDQFPIDPTRTEIYL